MSPNSEVSSNVSNIKEEVEEFTRGVKRSNVDQLDSEYGPSCPKTPKLEIEDSLSESLSCSEDQSSGSRSEKFLDPSRSVPKEEPEETLAELVLPTTCYEPALYPLPAQKRRGRPPGVKNRPKEMRIEKTVVPNKKRTYTAKTVFHYSMIITMALMNSPEERATVSMIYDFTVYHFPSIVAITSWKNALRHALSAQSGFQKEKLYCRSSFWYIIPERRNELIHTILETVVEYKDNAEAFMMRTIDDLPSILDGTFRISKEAVVTETKVEGPKPASDSEFEEILKIKPVSLKIVEKSAVPVAISSEQPEVAKQKPFHQVVAGSPFRYLTQEPAAPRGYWVPLADPSNPIYSNPWTQAYHPFVYGGPQSGYGMEMYGNVKKEPYY